jgi:pilus assembly protein Flp/PilA
MNKLFATLIALSTRPEKTDDRGATATEYAMLIAFIVIILVGALTIFGNAVADFFESIADTVGGWADGDF